MTLLVLRPQPGAAATAARAQALGMTAVVAPLFAAHALGWVPPDPAAYDAVMMTSANAPRLAGADLAGYAHLPAYAVGDATAAAMHDAGFADVTVGRGDADALVRAIAAGPHRRLLHLCGEHHHVPACPPGLAIDRIPVYRAAAVAALPDAARDALRCGALALLHSPRAGSHLAMLVDASDRTGTVLVAISAAAAAAAGSGWRAVAVAPMPTDADVLACARALCDKPPR